MMLWTVWVQDDSGARPVRKRITGDPLALLDEYRARFCGDVVWVRKYGDPPPDLTFRQDLARFDSGAEQATKGDSLRVLYKIRSSQLKSRRRRKRKP